MEVICFIKNYLFDEVYMVIVFVFVRFLLIENLMRMIFYILKKYSSEKVSIWNFNGDKFDRKLYFCKNYYKIVLE